MLSACASRFSAPSRQLLILLTVLALSLSIAVSAQAATYYVATTGSDSNPGTEAAPLRTIQKGADVARAGDTVVVMPGTYIGAIENKNDGTANARIRFVSKERWAAKVSSPTTTTIWRSIGDYVDIEGFEITGHTGGKSETWMGVIAYGTYSRIMYNHVHNIRTTDCNRGIGIDSIGYDTNFGTEIIGNLIHDIGGESFAGCGGSTDSATHDRGYGIYLATQFGKVQNNIIYNCGQWGIHLWHKPDGSVISHNLIFNSKNGINVGAGDSPFTGTGDNMTVSNNILLNNKRTSIRGYGRIGNNTRFMNNITYGNGYDDLTYGRNLSTTYLQPLMSGNLIGVDPKIPGLSGGDYRLGTGSPAIDTGATKCNSSVPNCVPTEDYWQGARPFNSKYDIGPHEFGSTPKSAPPLIPPTGGVGSLPGAPVLLGPNGEVCYSGYN
jgi:hypothetical protein